MRKYETPLIKISSFASDEILTGAAPNTASMNVWQGQVAAETVYHIVTTQLKEVQTILHFVE